MTNFECPLQTLSCDKPNNSETIPEGIIMARPTLYGQMKGERNAITFKLQLETFSQDIPDKSPILGYNSLSKNPYMNGPRYSKSTPKGLR